MRVVDALLLWTIVYGGHDTVLQYRTEEECLAAIADDLPYLGVPPSTELSCLPRPDLHPHQICGDGSVAYGWHCRVCMRQGEMVTSSLCEAHGYQGVR